MCDFCKDLNYREIKISIRTTLADDNICDFVSPDEYGINHSCEDCDGCLEDNNYFSITTWEDNLYIKYYHKIKDVVIAPISARFKINFCPMCGKKISDNDNERLVFW